jgi:hypothetical protein
VLGGVRTEEPEGSMTGWWSKGVEQELGKARGGLRDGTRKSLQLYSYRSQRPADTIQSLTRHFASPVVAAGVALRRSC